MHHNLLQLKMNINNMEYLYCKILDNKYLIIMIQIIINESVKYKIMFYIFHLL